MCGGWVGLRNSSYAGWSPRGQFSLYGLHVGPVHLVAFLLQGQVKQGLHAAARGCTHAAPRPISTVCHALPALVVIISD